MTTAGDILTEASAQLHGWGSTQDRITPLANSISDVDTTFTVSFAFGQAVGITPGVVEIGSEQLYVTAVDSASGNCTLAPGFGRAYNGTVAAAHAAGAAVISRPRFPRATLLKQVNEVIGSVFPSVFSVNTYTTSLKYPNNTYTLPKAPQWILDVQYLDLLNNWQRIHAYTVDPFDQTVRLTRTEGLVGRPLRILYATEPTPFTSETDDYSITGLPPSCVDLLTLGAVAKQVPGLDISRAQSTSVEQSTRGRTVPPFAGVNAAKYIMAEFQDRLRNEAMSLRRLYKPRITKVW